MGGKPGGDEEGSVYCVIGGPMHSRHGPIRQIGPFCVAIGKRRKHAYNCGGVINSATHRLGLTGWWLANGPRPAAHPPARSADIGWMRDGE